MNITSNNITMIIVFILAIVFLVSIVPTSSNAVKFDSEKLLAQCHAAILTGHPTSAPCLVIFGAIHPGSDTSNVQIVQIAQVVGMPEAQVMAEAQVLVVLEVQVLAEEVAEEVAEEHKEIEPLKIFKIVLISPYFCIYNK